MLSAENLALGYGSHVLLDGVSLEVRKGVITGLVAPNGYGKTTLLRALAGLGAGRARGLVRVDDIDPRDAPAMRRAVFYAPGDASLLYPALTVREHLRAAADLWGSGLDVEAMARRCGVDGFAAKRVRTLSQGMKQQVTLAIAYLTGARYLLLDEPMNALDPTNVGINTRLLRELARAGRGVVLSSHILANVDEVADEVLFIKDRHLLLGRGDSVDLYRRLYES